MVKVYLGMIYFLMLSHFTSIQFSLVRHVYKQHSSKPVKVVVMFVRMRYYGLNLIFIWPFDYQVIKWKEGKSHSI